MAVNRGVFQHHREKNFDPGTLIVTASVTWRKKADNHWFYAFQYFCFFLGNGRCATFHLNTKWLEHKYLCQFLGKKR